MLHLANLSHIGTLGRRGSSAIQLPDFFIPLTSSLALSRGVGSPTFTRNTTATVWGYDNSGNWTLLTIPAGTPRFEGARWTGSAWTNTFPDGSAIPDATLKGYLAEGQRTNLLTYSEQFDNAGWVKSIATVSANAAVSPSGLATAYKVVPNSGSMWTSVWKNVTVTAGDYTGSVYAKKGEWNYILLYIDGIFASFNLNNGTIGTVNSGLTASMVSVGNGWYRCSAKKTISSTSIILRVYPSALDGVATTAGDGTSGIYVWGAQLEQASFASSYIPTTSATVTRNGDVLTYPQNADGTKGASFADIRTQWTGQNNKGGRVLSVGSSRPALFFDATNGALSLNDGTSDRTGNVFSGSSSSQKIASKWGDSTSKTFISAVASSSLGFDGDMNVGVIGVGNDSSGANQLFGNVRNVKIWKKALTDTQLTNLTSPSA